METLKVYAAIIGGGASGLMCGCIASKNNPDKKIVIIERDNRVGKKIIVSGNSRCNLSNLSTCVEKYHSSIDDGINLLLKNYPPSKIIDYLNSIGLLTYVDSEQRVYPLSRQSSSVLSVLRNELKRNKAQELCDTEVLSISKSGKCYKINCSNKTIFAQKIVIATGGKNNYAQKVVSDTYCVARSLGHKITKLTPSLSPIKVNSSSIKSLKGIRVLGSVTAVVNEKAVKTELGEIQFGDDSLSGICVFNLSRILNRENNAYIIVKLLPEFSFAEIKDMIYSRIKLVSNEGIQELFTGMFHKNIGIALLKESKINLNKKASELSKTEINTLSNTINKWIFKTIPSNDFTCAQVTAGGVSGNEVDPFTFESKKAKGVYICGEALDVDGDCGGFNLQFAFSSGMRVGEQL